MSEPQDYQETKYSFQYATDEALTGATTVPGGILPAGFGDQAASVNLGSSLAPSDLLLPCGR
jgi:hypothetical protein